MKIDRYLLIPICLAGVVAGICLPGYFQADDFGLLAWLRYDHPSPMHWFDVWEMGIWRPFHLAAFWVETRWFGSQPVGYRLAHGFLYGVTVAVFFHLARRLLRSRRAGLIAAALFASAYSHWEAVFWICASSELWVGLLGAVMGLALLRADEPSPRFWGSVAVIAHMLALLAKENAVVLLPLAAGMVWHQRYAYSNSSLSRNHIPFFKAFPHPGPLPEGEGILEERVGTALIDQVKPIGCFGPIGLWLALVIPWMLALAWRGYLAAGGAAVQTGVFSLGPHVFHNAGAFLIRLFCPWITHPSLGWALAALGAAGSVAIYLVAARKYRLLLPLAWMLLALVPYMGIDTPGYYPSRYTYLAGMGWAMLIAGCLEPLWEMPGNLRPVLLTGVTGFCVFNVSLYAFHPEIRFFQKDDALYRQVVAELKKLNLPPVSRVAVTGLRLPLDEKIPNAIRYLYALAYAPPEQVWSGAEPWPGTPDLLLRWENGAFSASKPSKARE